VSVVARSPLGCRLRGGSLTSTGPPTAATSMMIDESEVETGCGL
jgi:hypothetical protein